MQIRGIPMGILGLDLICQAKSGTGKTCVFSVVVLQKVNIENLCAQSLVLAPTREIAVQIRDVIRNIGIYVKGLECHSFIGGIPVHIDKKLLNLGVHIVIGTPGRINQLININALTTISIKTVVLDEADQLFTESFMMDIKNIVLKGTPKYKQVMAFSATFIDKIENEICNYMRDPQYIFISQDKPSLKGITQYYIICDDDEKKDIIDDENEVYLDEQKINEIAMNKLKKDHQMLTVKINKLIDILNELPFNQCIIFTNNKNRGYDISNTLNSNGYISGFISGEQNQVNRLDNINKFREFKLRILVSSDLTSRGIDINNINLVINLDLPRKCETYLHRIGRTGRFGSYGISITFLDNYKQKITLDTFIKKLNTQIHKLPSNINNNDINYLSSLILNQTDKKKLNKLNTKNPSKNKKPDRIPLNKPNNLVYEMYYDKESNKQWNKFKNALKTGNQNLINQSTKPNNNNTSNTNNISHNNSNNFSHQPSHHNPYYHQTNSSPNITNPHTFHYNYSNYNYSSFWNDYNYDMKMQEFYKDLHKQAFIAAQNFHKMYG